MTDFTPKQNLNSKEVEKKEEQFQRIFPGFEDREEAWQQMHNFFEKQIPEVDYEYYNSYFKWYTDLSWKNLLNRSKSFVQDIAVSRQIFLAIVMDYDVIDKLLMYIESKCINEREAKNLYHNIRNNFLNSSAIIVSKKDKNITLSNVLNKFSQLSKSDDKSLEKAKFYTEIRELAPESKWINNAPLEFDDILDRLQELRNFVNKVTTENIYYVVDVYAYPEAHDEFESGEEAKKVLTSEEDALEEAEVSSEKKSSINEEESTASEGSVYLGQTEQKDTQPSDEQQSYSSNQEQNMSNEDQTQTQQDEKTEKVSIEEQKEQQESTGIDSEDNEEEHKTDSKEGSKQGQESSYSYDSENIDSTESDQSSPDDNNEDKKGKSKDKNEDQTVDVQDTENEVEKVDSENPEEKNEDLEKQEEESGSKDKERKERVEKNKNSDSKDQEGQQVEKEKSVEDIMTEEEKKKLDTSGDVNKAKENVEKHRGMELNQIQEEIESQFGELKDLDPDHIESFTKVLKSIARQQGKEGEVDNWYHFDPETGHFKWNQDVFSSDE